MNAPFSRPNTPTPQYRGTSSALPLRNGERVGVRWFRHSIPPFLWLALPLLISLTLTACKQGGAEGKPADVDYYTCTMHPSVKKQSPTDKCPICSMDLVPVKKKGVTDMSATNAAAPTTMSGDDKPGEFTIPVERQQQISVTYATVQKQPFTQTVR